MIGTNQMQMNEATMIEAVQQWLDSKMPIQSPKVTSVTNGSKYDYPFNVTLQERVPPKTDTGTDSALVEAK